MTTTDPVRAGDWLDRHCDGADPDEALAYVDSLPTVAPEEMLGRWRGSGLPTGSPLDGLLEAYGWYGKEFLEAERVHPLLFGAPGGPRPIDPALIPMGLLRDRPAVAHSAAARRAFTVVRPLLRTAKPRARLRTVEHHGVATAAMVYDALPIIDVFRRVSDDVRLGAMDMRGLPSPFLFVLTRDR